ncbi:MAG TPA: flagellar hook-basal body complex protein FliE [Gammaproteobacteria bacterium]|nr:flagellar hook-basal body complex protein FliE [Gammaproteobacteria bacterium]
MGNNIDVNKSLLEMQRMALQSQLPPTETKNRLPPGTPQNFTELFQQAIDNVNEVQKKSGELKKAFELGDPSVDLPQVMMASQKAGVAFEAMVQVRNKLLQAYKDVMSMPV